MNDNEEIELTPIAGPRVRQSPRRTLLPLILFAATCWSTWVAGGWAFSAAVMIILLAHEFGHFFQAHRYRVPASFPYFIPMPASPIGTMGAVIVMQPGIGNRRSLFDIAITGPLAGMVPALLFSVLGLQWSEVVAPTDGPIGIELGEPVLFKILAYLTFGPLPEGYEIRLNSIAYAGWVGIFITALNLMPIGQLDGGHILYTLLLKRARAVALAVLGGAMFAVVLWGFWGWSVMILLLLLMGPVHPPTADDGVPLGKWRIGLGWASLLFVPLGFVPVPFTIG